MTTLTDRLSSSNWQTGAVRAACTACCALASAACAAQWLDGNDQLRTELYQYRASTFLDGQNQSTDHIQPGAVGKPPTSRVTTGARLRAAPHWAQGWRMGAFVLSDAWISGSASTLGAIAAANRAQAPTRNASHPFDVAYQSMQRYGLSTGKDFGLAWLGAPTVSVDGHVFRVSKFREISASGVLTETAQGDLGLAANTVQTKLGGESVFINPPANLGWGASADVGLRWGEPQDSHYSLHVANLASTVRIPHVLQTTTRLNTQSASYDANGYVQFAPLISGKHSDVAYRPTLHPHTRAATSQRLSPGWALLASLSVQHPITELSLGGQWDAVGQRLQAQVHLSRDLPVSYGVVWRTRYANVAWRGDSLRSGSAKVWGWSASIQY